MDDFSPNGTIGRLYTINNFYTASKMLSKPSGICEKRLHEARKTLHIDVGETERAINFATSFRNECEELPQQIPEQYLNGLRQQLNDYIDGKSSWLPPEEALALRKKLTLYEDVYRPGPRLESPVTEAELQWEEQEKLKGSNSLTLTLLPPGPNLPGLLVRLFHGSEELVRDVNELSGNAFYSLGMAEAFKKNPDVSEKPPVERGSLKSRTYGVRVEPILQRTTPIAGSINFMGDDMFFRYVSRRFDLDSMGWFDVIGHGLPNKIEFMTPNGKFLVNHRVVAEMLKRTSGYNGQNIRLLSCSTGAWDKGFAQNLSNKMGVDVLAPTDLLWVYPDGRMIVAPASEKGGPDVGRQGEFKVFTPGGGDNAE